MSDSKTQVRFFTTQRGVHYTMNHADTQTMKSFSDVAVSCICNFCVDKYPENRESLRNCDKCREVDESGTKGDRDVHIRCEKPWLDDKGVNKWRKL